MPKKLLKLSTLLSWLSLLSTNSILLFYPYSHNSKYFLQQYQQLLSWSKLSLQLQMSLLAPQSLHALLSMLSLHIQLLLFPPQCLQTVTNINTVITVTMDTAVPTFTTVITVITAGRKAKNSYIFYVHYS